MWKIAVYCSKCRSHLDLLADFREGGAFSKPCPSLSRPLHHFRHLPALSKDKKYGIRAPDADTGFAWVDEQHFQCSAAECSAKLVIWFKPPRLIPDWVKQLTDKFMIKARAEKAMAEDPIRFEGHAIPLPINVLSNLRVYISNAVQTPGKSRKIPGHNKPFLLCLGESCTDLLEYIGFTREVMSDDVYEHCGVDQRACRETIGYHPSPKCLHHHIQQILAHRSCPHWRRQLAFVWTMYWRS